MITVSVSGISFMFRRERLDTAIKWFLELYPRRTFKQRVLVKCVVALVRGKVWTPSLSEPKLLGGSEHFPKEAILAYSMRQHKSDKYFGVVASGGEYGFFKAAISKVGQRKLEHEIRSLKKTPFAHHSVITLNTRVGTAANGNAVIVSDILPRSYKVARRDSTDSTYPFLSWSLERSRVKVVGSLISQHLPPSFCEKTFLEQVQFFDLSLTDQALCCPSHGDLMSNNIFVQDGTSDQSFALIDFENYCDDAPILTDLVGLYLGDNNVAKGAHRGMLIKYISENINLRNARYEYKENDVLLALIWLHSLGSAEAAHVLKEW